MNQDNQENIGNTETVNSIVDNFSTIIDHLDFQEGDRYIVHILRRKKDSDAVHGDDGQRLLKTYYVDSREYLERKQNAIKEMCHVFGARAYIIPQPRNNMQCLLNMAGKVLETLKRGDYAVKPDRLVREAYCGYHQSRKKQWIIDLDNDNMDGMTVEDVQLIISGLLDECGRKDEFYAVPTRNGSHIVTSPFDLRKAFEQCRMLYEGTKNGTDGWLHKDGMTLLYCE